jgi:hypothetical protein
MRILLVSCVALAVVSCSDSSRAKGTYTSSLAPTSLVDAQVFPGALPIFPFSAFACPASLAFETAFDFVITPARGTSVFVDSARVQLIDGTSLGPTLTFPRPRLDQMFGSTLVSGTRRFPFRPSFDCLAGRPTAIDVEAVLVEQSGNPRTVRVRAKFE